MSSALQVFDSLEQLLPRVEQPTPLLRLAKSGLPESFPVWAKLEWISAAGSLAGRSAQASIAALREGGQIGATRAVVSPVIAKHAASLVTAAQTAGAGVKSVLPLDSTEEIVSLLRFVGADIEIVKEGTCAEPPLGFRTITRAVSHAKASKEKFALANPFRDRTAAEVHYRTTGPEIWQQTAGQVTHVILPVTTGAALNGITRYLLEQNPAIKIIAAVVPDGARFAGLSSPGQLEESDFYLDISFRIETLEIEPEAALARTREIIKSEGLLAGLSSGLALEAAVRIAERDGTGHAVVIFPDQLIWDAGSLSWLEEKHGGAAASNGASPITASV